MAAILVADDDQTCRDSMCRVLEKEGYRVESAPDVDSALESLRQRHFDLVVCDYRMPGRSGIDLLKELKRQESHVPVLMISASVDAGLEAMALELGAVDMLEKPVRRRNLVERTALAMGGCWMRFA